MLSNFPFKTVILRMIKFLFLILLHSTSTMVCLGVVFVTFTLLEFYDTYFLNLWLEVFPHF